MRQHTALILCLATLTGAAPRAQLAEPGASGVVMGHLHLLTKDLKASRRFWTALGAPAGTRGRGLDHVGFEVKNLEEFSKKLEAAGQKFDRPYARLPNSTVAIAFLTDPWGTYIELTENLAPSK